MTLARVAWFLLLLAAAPVAAQEVAVPIDSAGRLELIDRALARRLGLFTDIPGFIEARLFAAPGGTFTLEITHRVDGRLARTRRTLSPAEADAFRTRVLAALTTDAPDALLDQSGRGELMRGGFVLALGFYSYAVPLALDVDDGRTAIGVATITAAGGFFLPLILTNNALVTRGQASLALWGGTRGIFHGMMAAALFDETSTRALMGWGLVASVAEGAAGYALAGRARMTQGHADAMGMLGDIGGGVGLAAAFLATDVNASDNDGLWAAGLAGSFLGALAGDRAARWETMTRGDVGVFRAAALLGTWVGFTTAMVANPDDLDDDGRPETLGALLGTGAGLVAARLLTHNHDFSNSDGTLISIGTLGGGLLGAGLGYLATPDGDSEDAVLMASAAGATLGFGLLYAALRTEAREVARDGRLSLRVNPLAPWLGDAPVRVPVMGLGVRF